MRRREFLAATGVGAATGLAGCLGEEVVVELQEIVRLQGGDGWTQRIEEPSGSAEVKYSAKSEDDRFEVFYFTDDSEHTKYKEFVSMDSDSRDEQVRNIQNRPTGHEKLSSIARHVEDEEIFRAKKPDSGRYSMKFDSTHHIALDYSNYGRLPLANKNSDIQITMEFEVVKTQF
jgi:hypothetical protein